MGISFWFVWKVLNFAVNLIYLKLFGEKQKFDWINLSILYLSNGDDVDGDGDDGHY